jgi:hypothetical protein
MIRRRLLVSRSIEHVVICAAAGSPLILTTNMLTLEDQETASLFSRESNHDYNQEEHMKTRSYYYERYI